MNFQITSSKVFGDSEGSGWVQVHDFTPSDKSKLESRGRLFAVISGGGVISEEGQVVDKVLAGREILTRLHEEYYGKADNTAFLGLKSAVSIVADEFNNQNLDFEIAVVVYLGDVVYSAVSGESFVSLFREGMLVKILEGRSGQITSASGLPKVGDVLVLGSSSFREKVSAGILRPALSRGSVTDIAEQIIPNIRSLEDSSRSGVVFVKFGSEDEDSVKTFQPGVSEKKPVIKKDEGDKAFPEKRPIVQKIISKLPKKNIRIKGAEIDEAVSHRRRVAVSVGVILLGLLLVSIIFGIKAKEEKDKRTLFEDSISEATHQLEEAISLYDLNPVRSRELFNQSKRSVENLLGSGVTYQEVYDLESSIKENEAIILGEYRVETDLFLDLTLLSDGFSGSSLSASEDLLAVMDSQNKRLVSVEIGSKRTEVIAGNDELNNPEKAAIYAGRFFVLDGSSIYEISEEDKDKVDDGFGSDSLIAAFAGNIYVLSKGDSKIWRVPGSERGFSDKSEWLSEGVEPDFSDVTSWSVDGNIWILTGGGKILRYSLGNKINFSIEGVFPPVSSSTSIFTDEDSQYLYVLDSENKRVVVSDKEGEYIAQYISEGLGEGKSIIVSEGEKKLIVLTGEKLLEIELDHLEE